MLIYFEEFLKASATLKNPWILTVQMFWHITLTLELVPLGLSRQPGAPVTEMHSLVKACPWPKWQSQTKTHKCVTREKKTTHGEHTLCCPHTHYTKAHSSRQGLPGHYTNNFFLRKQELRPFQATEIKVPHLPKLKVLLISINMTLIARAWEMTHLTNNAPLWIS